MNMWEYRVVKIKGDTERKLNELGKKGWELVEITGANYNNYCFKRKKNRYQKSFCNIVCEKTFHFFIKKVPTSFLAHRI